MQGGIMIKIENDRDRESGSDGDGESVRDGENITAWTIVLDNELLKLTRGQLGGPLQRLVGQVASERFSLDREVTTHQSKWQQQ